MFLNWLSGALAGVGGSDLLGQVMACPVAVGFMELVPRPPLAVIMRTPCCGRGVPGACLAVNSEIITMQTIGSLYLFSTNIDS